MIIAETSFDKAIEEFKVFLDSNALPTDIFWVFLEDTFSRKTDLYETDFWLKLPLPEENEELAKKHYKIGQTKNLGMGISAFALCEGKICCCIIIPKDKEDSELLFMSTEHLKFSFVQDMPIAQPIKSFLKRFLFNLLVFKYKKGNFIGYLESKENLRFQGI